MFPGERCELHDLTRMELTILSVLSWRTLGVTSVNLVDPLISLLDLQHPALQAAGGLEMACTIREGCKLAIARSLRGQCLLLINEAHFIRGKLLSLWSYAHLNSRWLGSRAHRPQLSPVMEGRACRGII